MRVPDNLDIYEMHERERERRTRRAERTKYIDRHVDSQTEEKRANNEKRTTGKD